jgi:Putative auto-transporter adhesin, head GIN domain
MRTRSIFWPLVLIATGVIWILAQAGGMPSANLWALLYAVPFVLMALGVGLMLGTRWMWARQIVSVLAVGGALAAVVFAAPLRWNVPPNWGCVWSGSPISGCYGVGGSIRGSGVIVMETRELAPFDGVSVDYPAAVTVLQGDAQTVTVEADDNFLPQLTTRVTGGVLHIEVAGIAYGQRVTPSREVRVTLTVKDLRRVDLSSAGSVKVDGLETSALKISVSGAGSLTISRLTVQSLTLDLSGVGSVTVGGTADNIALNISGVGSFHGEALEAQNATVNISGMGSATCWVKVLLTADISGTGSVSYYGSPEIRKDVSGLGSVRKLGDK